MSRLKLRVMALSVALAPLVACGGSDEPSGPEGFSAPCGEECSDEEVTETGCNTDAVDAVTAEVVTVGQAVGTLSMRKANPSVCEGIYWTRFVPEPDNAAEFELTLVRNDEPSQVQ
jgi:hypothetical protein